MRRNFWPYSTTNFIAWVKEAVAKS